MINEVAPPGFGHTKSGKGDKKGGTAAAFDRARKRGDFKGTKSQMFAIMWSQKNKGDKPHYKPGTDKKYKKYQDEDWKPEIEHSKLGDAVKKKSEKKRKEAESSLPPHLRLDAMKKAFAHTNEEKQITPMQDNNLFGNAYAGTPPPKKKKKLKESSFRDYMDQAQAARDRVKKKQEERKKKDAQFADTKKHGIKFYDKKGSGRIVKGKKVYN